MRDEREFELYVAARWSTFHRLAMLLSGSSSRADDLMQATFERAFVAWPRISRMAAPDAYVRRIMVTSLASTQRRAWWRREQVSAEVPDTETESDEAAVLDRAFIWPLVCALPSRQRAVIVLRYYENLTEAEIAEALGCSTGTVKSTAHDAMRALRRGLAATRVPEGMQP